MPGGEVTELRASRRRLVLAGDAERRRIERRLHDGLQQQLVALAVEIQLTREVAGGDPAVVARLDELKRTVNGALEEAATLAHRIHPPLVEAGGLAAALRTAAGAAGVRATIDVDAAQGHTPGVAITLYDCWLAALDRTAEGAQATIAAHAGDDATAFAIVVDVPSPAGACEEIRDLLGDRVEALGGQLETAIDDEGNVRIGGAFPVSR